LKRNFEETEMKPFDYYSKPQTLYPNKKDYITSYVYDKGVVLWSGPTWEKDKAELKEEYPINFTKSL